MKIYQNGSNGITHNEPDGLAPDVVLAKPFVKWVGGKRRLLAELIQRIPPDFKAYHEPFIGGGALFFKLISQNASLVGVISDRNPDLVNAYLVVKNKVELLISALKEYPYNEAFFYDIRKKHPRDLSDVESAARFIYLNKAGYNGLYRVNSQGLFNVPFGRHRNPTICDEDNLRACSKALSSTRAFDADFTTILDRAEKGDFIYLDPPYFPVSKTSNFTSYVKNGFGVAEHESLKEVFSNLDKKGCYVMLSNSFTEFTVSLYESYNLETVHATRCVNSDAKSRGKVREILVRNYEK